MSDLRRIVIVGAGPAGVGAAIGARAQDATAEITLIGDEPHEPYEKPPLSKAVLTGKAMPHDAPIAGPNGVAGHRIDFKGSMRVTAIDRVGRTVVSENGGRIRYDALVIASGATNRLVPMFPPAQNGIYYLRTQDEALALKAHLERSQALAVIGGGLIGLEVAASAAERGVKTSVIEIAPRILGRVCDEETAAFVLARHRERGVTIHLGTAVSALSVLPDGRFAITLADGGTIQADLIVVGIGARPDDGLAMACGLEVKDGIIVDEFCHTSEPTIFAAGDCTRFPGPHGPVRMENWRHAQEQGVVAGRNAAGANLAYNTAPSFWSEQYDLYIQGVGWPIPNPSARIRRSGGIAPLTFELDGTHLTYVLGINAQRDIATARRLIERKIPVAPTDLADPGKPLATLLKAKV